ncbi:RcpC/CpaB family pilus assembly protein [Phycicoccus duodecadis]|uniref:Pilus assembly protein CpaB n=1 Tax=Phycicoccus duodecadis TaxID=173053 RepID=A0A2N3YK34_9MICO|nr:RcpC/CpaB family pilus assembly protein [Phycicoccus duodecadis]PKW27169.1 pilus assembly protein CpaB [Phycicoccus duodecadis]
MGRRILAIIAAAVIALIGAVLVLVYARGADARAVAAASPVSIYVTTQVVPAGTSLKDAVRLGQVAQTQVASRAKPLGALGGVDDTNGALVALTDIQPGQYVLSGAFGDTPVGQKAIQVAAGKLAVSVQLADPARVGTFVTPGSYITIFMTYPLAKLGSTAGAAAPTTTGGASADGASATSVLLDNVKVIAMGNALLTPTQQQQQAAANGDENAQQATGGFLVTLEVDPAQAARLIQGVNNYTLYAGLRGSELKIDPNLQVSDLTMLKDKTR